MLPQGWIAIGLGCFFLGTSLDAACPRGGDDFPSYRDVPLVVGDLEPVRMILQDCIDRSSRVLILGDSQETSPGGHGRAYIPHLQRLMAEYSGGIDRSPIRGNASMGSGSPPAGWLSTVSAGIGLPSDSGLRSDQIPPGMVPVHLSATDLGPGVYGPRFTLVHDAAGTADPTWTPGSVFINPDDVAIQVFAMGTAEGDCRVAIRQRPTNALVGWSSVTESEHVLLSPSDELPGILTGFSRRLDRRDFTYHQVEVLPSEDSPDFILLGARFVQVAQQGGLEAMVCSKGGNSIQRFLSEHGESGPLLALDQPSVVVIQLGANDVITRTPAEFESDVRTLIDWLRLAFDSPCMPMVLVGDPWRITPRSATERQDRYPGVLAAIAEDTPGVVAVNQRLALEDRFGWGPADTSFLTDDVHLTPDAQVLSAETVFEILMGDHRPGCIADLNGDGKVGSADFGLLLLHWRLETSECIQTGDLDRDGRVGSSDYGLMLMQWGPC